MHEHAVMAVRAVKTEAVVLRSIRYGEADRILHLYTPARGRVGAIAKGVRRARSRFGGRLEPFFRLRIELHEGRGELLTVTGAQTIDAHARLRGDAHALDAAARACDAVGRLFETSEPHPGVFNLLCRKLALLDQQVASAHHAEADGALSPRADALAFRLKLVLAAGLAPQLDACACCGESRLTTTCIPTASRAFPCVIVASHTSEMAPREIACNRRNLPKRA